MYFFGISMRKFYYCFYNFYLITAFKHSSASTIMVKVDDYCNYDSIVLLLNNFKILVDLFGEDFLTKITVNLITRNLYNGLCLCISFIINNYKTNTKLYYYNAVDFFEREVWDMYGIVFNNHPNLTRLLTDYGFIGFPLRKEFPLTGFYELFYNGEFRCIESRKVFLKQDYNYFGGNSTWFF